MRAHKIVRELAQPPAAPRLQRLVLLLQLVLVQELAELQEHKIGLGRLLAVLQRWPQVPVLMSLQL